MFSEIYKNEETIANFGRNSHEAGSFGSTSPCHSHSHQITREPL